MRPKFQSQPIVDGHRIDSYPGATIPGCVPHHKRTVNDGEEHYLLQCRHPSSSSHRICLRDFAYRSQLDVQVFPRGLLDERHHGDLWIEVQPQPDANSRWLAGSLIYIIYFHQQNYFKTMLSHVQIEQGKECCCYGRGRAKHRCDTNHYRGLFVHNLAHLHAVDGQIPTRSAPLSFSLEIQGSRKIKVPPCRQ